MDTSPHIIRCLRIVTLLSSGRRLSTSEIADELAKHTDDKVVTIRQIQRDLRSIEEAGIPLVDTREGTSIRWSIPHHARLTQPLSIEDHELLSLHILKGALVSFKGTQIEHDVEKLARKLEKVAPGKVFLQEEVVSEVSPGRFATTVSDEAMRAIIAAIVDPHWDRVTYRSVRASTPKTFVVSFCRLINHAGRLYVAAWHPVHNQYLTLAADRIDHVERASDVTDRIHVFDEKKYRSGRFGVYDGDVATIKLRIDADAADHFLSRLWHPTQEFKRRKDGRVDLQLRAPLSPELVSWVVGWADVLEIISPAKLIIMCQAKTKRLFS
jgi:predicted DNA-binding transcriptional regulator YafY